VTRLNAFRPSLRSALLVTVAARSRPSFAARWCTRGARPMILSITVVAFVPNQRRHEAFDPHLS
jgi:hypothetical protein